MIEWKTIKLHGIVDGRCTCHRAGRCRFAGKHPYGLRWQQNWTTDRETIQGWLRGGFNNGLILGETSGLIDVEEDGESVEIEGKTPTYVSARGRHRIYRWEPGLPKLAVVKAGGLEFRIGNMGAAQSVLPPSKHKSGRYYRWLISPEDCEPAPLPKKLRALLREPESARTFPRYEIRPAYQGPSILAGGILRGDDRRPALEEMARHSMVGRRDREKPIALRALVLANLAKCRPPLPLEELRKMI